MTEKQLLGEVSLRCGDADFKDFEKSIYQRGIYRSNREIAKFYGILQKIYTFTLRDMTSNIDGDIILDLPDMKAEYLVSVNGNQLIKVANQLEPDFRYAYYLELREGQWHFNYTLGDNGIVSGIDVTGQDITTTMSQSLFERIESSDVQTTIKGFTDEVTICYTVIPDLENEIGEYDIPTKYEEEQIDRCVNYISKLGIAKYPNSESEKGQKYIGLYKMYKMDHRGDYDKDLARDTEFIKIKPWSVV